MTDRVPITALRRLDDPDDQPPADDAPLGLDDVDVFELPWPDPFETTAQIPSIRAATRAHEVSNPPLSDTSVPILGRGRIEEVLRAVSAAGDTLIHDEELLYLLPGHW